MSWVAYALIRPTTFCLMLEVAVVTCVGCWALTSVVHECQKMEDNEQMVGVPSYKNMSSDWLILQNSYTAVLHAI